MNLLNGIDKTKCDIRITNLDPDEFGKDRMHINSVTALTKGGGKYGISIVCNNADKFGIILSLNAIPYYTKLYDNLIAENDLVQWYSRFGFKRINSNNGVFAYMSNLMVRYAVI